MGCVCARCRRFDQLVGGVGVLTAKVDLQAAAALALLLLVVLPALLLGAGPVPAFLLGAVVSGSVVVGGRALAKRSDPLAPLPAEWWLRDHPEPWPWWLLGGVLGLIGVLLLPVVGLAVPTLVVAGIVGLVPGLARELEACRRLSG